MWSWTNYEEQPRWNNHIDKITTKGNKNLLKELLGDFKMFLLW